MIKEWREKKGVSQVKLAEMLGVTLRTVSRWESEGYKSRMLELALRGLDVPTQIAPTYISGRIVIPHEEEMILKKQAGRDWDEIKYGNPGDEREMAWVGLLKYAARVHGGNYKAYYESELKRYGREDDEVFEWS